MVIMLSLHFVTSIHYIFLIKLMHLKEFGVVSQMELYVANVDIILTTTFDISLVFLCRLHPVWMECYSDCDWCSCPSGYNNTFHHCQKWSSLLQEIRIV